MSTRPMPGHSDTTDELEELKVMAVLHGWLDRWLPLQAHRVLLTGAIPATGAAAMGVELPELETCWRAWAARQRNLHRRMGIGLSDDEHDQVASQLAS